MQVTDWLLGSAHMKKNPNSTAKILKTELKLKLQLTESWLELGRKLN